MQLSAQSKSCRVSLCRAVSSQVSIFGDSSSTISLSQHLILDTVISSRGKKIKIKIISVYL